MAFFALFTTSRIKTVLAGELDCPQDNQALQASTEFRFETGFSIVFIQCCKLGFIFQPGFLSVAIVSPLFFPTSRNLL